MTGSEMVPMLMFLALGVGSIVGVGLLLAFLRKRSDRAADKRAVDIDRTGARR